MSKKFICLFLAFLLLTGAAAYADSLTRADVRTEKGAWNSAAYENVVPDWLGRPYDLTERFLAEGRLSVWELPSEQDEHGWHELYSMPYLRSTGIAAEAVIDFDQDGADEWITVETRPSEGESYAGRPVLWVCVYEMDGEAVSLADEWLISDSPLDSVGDGMHLFFSETDGVTALISINAYAVDGRWHEVWRIVYDGAQLNLTDGTAVSFDEAGGANVCTFFPGSADTTAELSPWISDLQTSQQFASGEDDGFINALSIAVAPMALGVEYEDRNVYNFRLAPAVPGIRTLMSVDCHAYDESGKGVVRIERSIPSVRTAGTVNLRNQPSLSGTIVGGAQEGEWFTWLGEQSIDDRGVVWYLVQHKGGEAWISSRFSVLE